MAMAMVMMMGEGEEEGKEVGEKGDSRTCMVHIWDRGWKDCIHQKKEETD
jgi:hypothetical protein